MYVYTHNVYIRVCICRCVYVPAVLRSHFAGVRVEDAVAAAGWLGAAPAGLPAVSCRLAVLLVRPHHALAACGVERGRERERGRKEEKNEASDKNWLKPSQMKMPTYARRPSTIIRAGREIHH